MCVRTTQTNTNNTNSNSNFVCVAMRPMDEWMDKLIWRYWIRFQMSLSVHLYGKRFNLILLNFPFASYSKCLYAFLFLSYCLRSGTAGVVWYVYIKPRKYWSGDFFIYVSIFKVLDSRCEQKLMYFSYDSFLLCSSIGHRCVWPMLRFSLCACYIFVVQRTATEWTFYM